jgi:YfiH family protein
MVTDDATRTLSVRVADCVPVLFASSDGRVVAAVHAGWRGVIAGVVPRAIETMRTLDARSIIAVIGPAISFNAFEVGPEVLDEFQHKFQDPALIRRRADGKGYVDLRSAILRQLQQASVADRWIDTTDRCTFRDAEEFYSHRRDNGVTGRMAAVISPAG